MRVVLWSAELLRESLHFTRKTKVFRCQATPSKNCNMYGPKASLSLAWSIPFECPELKIRHVSTETIVLQMPCLFVGWASLFMSLTNDSMALKAYVRVCPKYPGVPFRSLSLSLSLSLFGGVYQIPHPPLPCSKSVCRGIPLRWCCLSFSLSLSLLGGVYQNSSSTSPLL